MLRPITALVTGFRIANVVVGKLSAFAGHAGCADAIAAAITHAAAIDPRARFIFMPLLTLTLSGTLTPQALCALPLRHRQSRCSIQSSAPTPTSNAFSRDAPAPS